MNEKYIKVSGNKIRYLEEGTSKNNIVLLHGLGSHAERWERVIPYLSKKYRVIAPDIIGFGYSDKPSVDYTPEFFVKFVFDFLETLGIDKTVLIGSSLGGQIATDCAATQSKSLAKIVLVSPSGTMKVSNPTLDAYTMAALYPTKNTVRTAYEMMSGSDKIEPQTIEHFIERMLQPNAKMVFMSTILCLRHAPTIREKLAKISSPTLVVWGRKDTMIPLEYSKDFVLSIKNCKFVVMEDCSHRPHSEAPKKFSKVVLEFLDQ